MPFRKIDPNMNFVFWCSLPFACMAFLLNKHAQENNMKWHELLIEFVWYVVFSCILGMLFSSWLLSIGGPTMLCGFIGSCCFMQKYLRAMIFKILIMLSTEPIKTMAEIIDVWKGRKTLPPPDEGDVE